jgi:hypothetical protein
MCRWSRIPGDINRIIAIIIAITIIIVVIPVVVITP